MQTRYRSILVLSLAAALGWAQESAVPDQPAPPPREAQPQQEAQPPQEAPPPPSSAWHRFGPQAQMSAPLPATLTLPAGTWITVRVDQEISSDRNQVGDFFPATLAQPLVADGVVVARRGQTVGGVVAEAGKGGRVKGVSRLGLQLTELSLADGRQVQVRTRLMDRRGDTSIGRDAAAIGTSTGVGAAIGAAADGGFGAGMGAIAGAAASTIGVLVTRGKPTVVYPETALMFRLEAPVAISTAAAPGAFQPVRQGDYEQRSLQRPAPPPRRYSYGAGWGYYPYYGGLYPPFYYGPSLYFGWGHRGFHRGW
jgi:hypothetical protein